MEWFSYSRIWPTVTQPYIIIGRILKAAFLLVFLQLRARFCWHGGKLWSFYKLNLKMIIINILPFCRNGNEQQIVNSNYFPQPERLYKSWYFNSETVSPSQVEANSYFSYYSSTNFSINWNVLITILARTHSISFATWTKNFFGFLSHNIPSARIILIYNT